MSDKKKADWFRVKPGDELVTDISIGGTDVDISKSMIIDEDGPTVSVDRLVFTGDKKAFANSAVNIPRLAKMQERLDKEIKSIGWCTLCVDGGVCLDGEFTLDELKTMVDVLS